MGYIYIGFLAILGFDDFTTSGQNDDAKSIKCKNALTLILV